jgi:hypothetical protein
MPVQPYKLDTDFGELLYQQLAAEAEARGQKRGELVRELVRESLLARAAVRDQVRAAVLALAAAVEPDERYDPAGDPRESEAIGRLAALLGSAYAAQGVAEALHDLWTARHLPEPAGLQIGEPYLAWLDELVEAARQPETRETLVEQLISEARGRHE